MPNFKQGQHNLNISLRSNNEGKQVVSYASTQEFSPPPSHGERLEWIRQSYERFLAKVLEKEALVGVPPTDIS